MAETRTKKELTHERIVDAASRAIRRAGFDGVGVADIMKEAGLTHGGFYAHFDSREAMLAEALDRAGQESLVRISHMVKERSADGASPFRAFVEQYLSERHLLAPEKGCAVAALASEMPRQAPALAEASVARIRALVAQVRGMLPAGAAREAPAVVAQLVGAIQIARTLGDSTDGRAVLASVRRLLLERYDASRPG